DASGEVDAPTTEAAASATVPDRLPATVVSRPTEMSVVSGGAPAARPVIAPLTSASPDAVGVTARASAGAVALLVMLIACDSGVPTITFGNTTGLGVLTVIAAGFGAPTAGVTVPSTVTT